MSVPTTRMLLNGAPPTVGELQALALKTYGHYTSFIARDGAVRGWSLHQQRLQHDAHHLFGIDLDLHALAVHLRGLLGMATAPDALQSVRIAVLPRHAVLAQLSGAMAVDLLLSSLAWQAPPATPLRLHSVLGVRDAARHKHIGLSGALLARRQAQLAGADDALLLDSSGRLAEGPTWNLGVYDGQGVRWPDAAALPGVTQQLLGLGLVAHGIPSTSASLQRADLHAARSVFACNARQPCMPICALDGEPLPRDLRFEAQLQRICEELPWQLI